MDGEEDDEAAASSTVRADHAGSDHRAGQHDVAARRLDRRVDPDQRPKAHHHAVRPELGVDLEALEGASSSDGFRLW
jgi:hypothetical protein